MTDHQEIWCQPAGQPKRQFLVMFDDPQMDVAVFDDEAEARAYWEKANLNWTCYLMGTMPRSPAPQTNTTPLTCHCANSKTDPCIVCGKGKTLVTAEWMQKMAAREGDHDATTGSPSPQSNVEPKTAERHLSAEDVQWVTNDIAELGVKIGNQFFFLYKGESLVYGALDPDPTITPVHDDGSPMHWRSVFKREFGECAHPINYQNPKLVGTVSLDDSDQWEVLPAARQVNTPSPQTKSVIAPADYQDKLSDFIDALDEWGCEDNNERAEQIIEFQRTGYDLDAYLVEHPDRPKSEVN